MKLRIIIICFFIVSTFVYAQNNEESRRATIQYGTETEIASLIQTLRNEKEEYLDDELVILIENTRNQRILTSVFGFFGEREKGGLEERALRAIQEREDETNETILAAVDYLGRVKPAEAIPVLMELLNTGERRFMNSAFRALGRASSSDSEAAGEIADFLIDFYNNQNPGTENQSEVITAIGATRSSNGVSFLAEIVTDNSARTPLRIAALGALSSIGDNDGLEAIIGCISAGDPNVRSAAVSALGPFSGEDVDKAILEAFRDSYYRTRIAAAQASGARKFEAAVPYLRYRAERDETANVKDEAVRALGAIANEEANTVLESLFAERRNPDRVRILAAEMLFKNEPDKHFTKLIIELDDAKTKNQTALYNGLLKVIGETKLAGDKTEIVNITSRFLLNGGIIEKLYGLDMAANNGLVMLSPQIKTMTGDRNETIARRARRTAETLGIELSDE
ncbi:MAG: HEAT repeat domain-containing protein [Treponema sp.]|jgi:HEAT repeat protein|nr:HEAT repeat domain-containing protein [Treponema sp.]